MLELEVQSWVSSVKSSGLSTHPWGGGAVLSVMVLDLIFPTCTVWGPSVRKTRILLQVEVLSLSRSSLPISCWAMMVLNAKIKSVNSILRWTLH